MAKIEIDYSVYQSLKDKIDKLENDIIQLKKINEKEDETILLLRYTLENIQETGLFERIFKWNEIEEEIIETINQIEKEKWFNMEDGEIGLTLNATTAFNNLFETIFASSVSESKHCDLNSILSSTEKMEKRLHELYNSFDLDKAEFDNLMDEINNIKNNIQPFV